MNEIMSCGNKNAIKMDGQHYNINIYNYYSGNACQQLINTYVLRVVAVKRGREIILISDSTQIGISYISLHNIKRLEIITTISFHTLHYFFVITKQ